MTVPVLTFFNHKSGVGSTSLVYHLAWMLSDMDCRVLVCDLNPQANLTTAFLDEDRLETLWGDGDDGDDDNGASGQTIMQCVRPLLEAGDIRPPALNRIVSTLNLIPGDLALAGFEDALSAAWLDAPGSGNRHRSLRILTAFSTVMQDGAKQMDASIVLADVGPNLGAINRSALIATDNIIVPLGADLLSLQSLRNLGSTLNRWRRDWQQQRDNQEKPDFPLPNGGMRPVGYVVQQHGICLSRPIRAYDKWVNRMPEEYARNLLGDGKGPYPETTAQDEEHAFATIKHYRSLVSMAQEVRKPFFHLTPADGAIGSHAAAARGAKEDFRLLAGKIAKKVIGEASGTGREGMAAEDGRA